MWLVRSEKVRRNDWCFHFSRLTSHFSLLFRCSRVERIAEAIPEKIKRKERNREDQSGINQQPRKLFHHFGALFDEDAPGTHRRLDTETEKTQECFQQHPRRDGERGINDNRPKRVWNHVPKDDSRLGKSERLSGFNKLLMP